jgi:hypothetical protein
MKRNTTPLLSLIGKLITFNAEIAGRKKNESKLTLCQSNGKFGFVLSIPFI